MKPVKLARIIISVLLALVIAAVVGTVAGHVSERLRTKAIAASSQRIYRSAASFTEAVTDWITRDAYEHLARGVDLLLLGSASTVHVFYNDSLLLQAHDADWTGDSFSALDYPVLAPQSEIEWSDGRPLLTSITPIRENGMFVGYVHVVWQAPLLESSLRSSLLSVVLCGALAWSLLSVAAIYATNIGMRHRSRRLTAPTKPLGTELKAYFLPNTLQIDISAKTIAFGGVSKTITPKPFTLLSLLAMDTSRVFSDQEIIEHVWKDVRYVTANDVHQCIYRLRKSLDGIKPGLGACVANVKGFGYQLDISKHPVHVEPMPSLQDS